MLFYIKIVEVKLIDMMLNLIVVNVNYIVIIYFVDNGRVVKNV